MVVWIAVGGFAGMLGLASVTDYCVPARGNDRCSAGRRGIDTEAARLRETLPAPQVRSSRSWNKRWDVRPWPC